MKMLRIGRLGGVLLVLGFVPASELLAAGSGPLFGHLTFDVGNTPLSVAIGDLDGDGHAELAVVNNVPGAYVSVLLGLGDGTFAAAAYYPAGSGPQSVAIGDLNGGRVPQSRPEVRTAWAHRRLDRGAGKECGRPM